MNNDDRWRRHRLHASTISSQSTFLDCLLDAHLERKESAA